MVTINTNTQGNLGSFNYSTNRISVTGGGYIPMSHIIDMSVSTNSSDWPIYQYTTRSPINPGPEKETELVSDTPQYPGDSLAEALFEIQPRLKRKYKGDKRALQADIMWAAQHTLQGKAYKRLSSVLDLEGGK